MEAAPVLESVEPGGDALDPPIFILVGIEDKLNGRLHFQLPLQREQVLLPRTATLGEQQHLPTRVHLGAER